MGQHLETAACLDEGDALALWLLDEPVWPDLVVAVAAVTEDDRKSRRTEGPCGRERPPARPDPTEGRVSG